jgi:hypothetical protein
LWVQFSTLGRVPDLLQASSFPLQLLSTLFRVFQCSDAPLSSPIIWLTVVNVMKTFAILVIGTLGKEAQVDWKKCRISFLR